MNPYRDKAAIRFPDLPDKRLSSKLLLEISEVHIFPVASADDGPAVLVVDNHGVNQVRIQHDPALDQAVHFIEILPRSSNGYATLA